MTREIERYLVTGANGFIGSALSTRLEREGAVVHRLVRRSTAPGDIVAELGRDPIPPLRDLELSAIFHLAGRVHEVDDGPDAEAQHELSTVAGTRDLITAAVESEVPVFIYFSSCAVLGEGSLQGLDETAPPRPESAYARAKLTAERLVLDANGIAGMRTTCLRMPLVYGAGQKGNLPRMIHAIEGGFFPPVPDFGNRRSMVHVDDVVEAALRVARAPISAGETYIVAEPRSYSSREVYEILTTAVGRRPPGWRVPKSVLRAAALAGDGAYWLTRKRLGFDSTQLAKLSASAVYRPEKLDRDLGLTTSRTFASSAAEIVRLSPHAESS
jgi:UDP-glucose 4-epimerase